MMGDLPVGALFLVSGLTSSSHRQYSNPGVVTNSELPRYLEKVGVRKSRIKLFKKAKSEFKRRQAKKQIAAYESRHRSKGPLVERPEGLPVESTFDSFVESFGGKKISDLIETKAQMPLNADYLFRDHNVIAELKTLEGIYSGPTSASALAQAFIDRGRPPEELMHFMFGEGDMHEDVAKLIRTRLRRSLEQRIKYARKQLRQSKALLGNAESRTLILIAMNEHPLFGHQNMLLNLAKIMGDNYADEHTDGVVYLNPNMPSKASSDGMEFSGWFPFYRDDKTNDSFSAFVNLLGNRWLAYYGEKIGQPKPILELNMPEGMLEVLRGA